MNNCRIRRTGTLARRGRTDGQECPSYNRFATVVSWLILARISGNRQVVSITSIPTGTRPVAKFTVHHSGL